MQEKTGIEVEVEAKKYKAFVKIDGKSVQETRSGKNYFDATKIKNSAITVNDNGKTITMPIASSGNGYTSTSSTLQELCPDLKVGDTVYLIFDTNFATINQYIYLNNLWHNYNYNQSSRTITQEDLDATVSLYGNRYYDGETEQVILSNFRIVKNVDDEWEQYGASPSPEFPSTINSLGDDVNIFDGEFESGIIVGSTGTNTDENNYIRNKNFIPVEELTNYKFSTDSSLFSSVYVYEYKEDKTYNQTATKVVSLTSYLTTNEGTAYIRFRPSTAFTDTNIKVKLQKGTVATAFSECGKGTIEIKQEGKNKFNYNGEIFSNSGNSLEIMQPKIRAINKTGGNFTFSGIILPLEINDIINKNINLSAEIEVSADNIGMLNIYLLNSNKSLIKSIGNIKETGSIPISVTSSMIPEEAKYIALLIYSNTTGTANIGDYVDYTNIQIKINSEDNEEDSDYEPYFSNSYVLQVSEPLRSLPSGVKDTIEEDGIHRRVGIGKFQAVNQLYDSRGFKYGTNSIKSINTSAENINIICDKAICNVVNAKTNDIYITNFGNTLVIVGATDDTVETFNEKFAGAEYIYELAEEVIEPYAEEEQEIIDSIENQNGTNIFYVDDELEPIITVIYKGKDEEWDSTDIISLKYFNELITNIQTYANKLGIKHNLTEKSNGEFLFSEELDEIDRVLEVISNTLLFNYSRKHWYNLSTINYSDWTRWNDQIDLIESKIKNIKVFTYNDDATDDQNTYMKLLYEEV